MVPDVFRAYFIRNGRSAGDDLRAMPDRGAYPTRIEWEGNIYRLMDGAPEDHEAHYVAED